MYGLQTIDIVPVTYLLIYWYLPFDTLQPWYPTLSITIHLSKNSVPIAFILV